MQVRVGLCQTWSPQMLKVYENLLIFNTKLQFHFNIRFRNLNYISPNSQSGNGGTTLGELISDAARQLLGNHRVPSTRTPQLTSSAPEGVSQLEEKA